MGSMFGLATLCARLAGVYLVKVVMDVVRKLC